MAVINEAVINYELYHNSTRYLGTAEVQLPDLKFKEVEVSGAGLAGEFSAPIQGHTESLEVEIKWRTLSKRSIALMKHGALILQARAALQNYNTSGGDVEIVPLRIDMKGRTKGTNLGTLKPAESQENTTTLELSYLKIVYNNGDTVEIDKLNYIYRVNAIDYLSPVRLSLGLAS